MKARVFVTRRWPAAVEQQLLEKFDATLNDSDEPLDAVQMQSILTKYDAVLATVTDPLDAKTLGAVDRAAVRTRIVGNYGVGFSHISLETAQSLGIVVTNTPDVLSDCTADTAMMLMLMSARRAGEAEREIRGGGWTGWRPTHLIGQKVSGSTLGIVGFGRIGKAVAQRAGGFGMRVIVYNRSAIDPQTLARYGASQCDSLSELMARADFVSLHCPGGEDNVDLIGRQQLAAMKPTAHLINTARGEVVNENALLEALSSGQIAGAGLDVFCNEPHINPAFLVLDNVTLLPHIGSASSATRNQMGFRVIENIQAYFDHQEPPDRIV